MLCDESLSVVLAVIFVCRLCNVLHLKVFVLDITRYENFASVAIYDLNYKQLMIIYLKNGTFLNVLKLLLLRCNHFQRLGKRSLPDNLKYNLTDISFTRANIGDCVIFLRLCH